MESSSDYERNQTTNEQKVAGQLSDVACNVHHSMGYEQSQSLTAAPPQHQVNPNFPAPGSFNQQLVTVVTGQTAGAPLAVGPRKIKTTCPTCSKHITSRTSTKNSCCCKFCLCTILCLSGVCLPCACLPFCMCGPETVTHSCPKCNTHLGTWVNH